MNAKYQPAIEWAAAQACGDCGTDAAFIRRSGDGAAICRECEHEHPMNTWDLGADEVFMWASSVVPQRIPNVLPGRVLFVVAYATTDMDY